MRRLPDAPAVEFKLITIPIDDQLLDCGHQADDWTPESIATLDDALALAGRLQQALDDCRTDMELIRKAQRQAPQLPLDDAPPAAVAPVDRRPGAKTGELVG